MIRRRPWGVPGLVGWSSTACENAEVLLPCYSQRQGDVERVAQPRAGARISSSPVPG